MTAHPDPIAPAAAQPLAQTPQPTASSERNAPLFSQHAAIVLVMAVIIGGLVSALTYCKSRSLADAALAGLFAAGASAPVLHKLIG